MVAARCVARLTFLALVSVGLLASTLAAQEIPLGLPGPPPPPTYGVSVTPDGESTERTPNILTSVTFTVRNTGNVSDTYGLSCLDEGSVACQQADLGTMTLAAGAQNTKRVFFTTGAANTTGSVGLTASSTTAEAGDGGSYLVWIFSGPPPVVSLAPTSPGHSPAADGATYAHAVPAFGSMGVLRTLSLVYNSTAVRPVSLVTVDVSNSQSPYPSTYQIQVQLAANGTYLQLMNGTTSAYYTAATTTPTRMVAAIDAQANGLGTGWYPVTVVVNAHYAQGPRVATVSSRLLVNNQTGSSFGAGVGLAGIPRLYSMTGSYSLLLVDGQGAMVYFDRTCATCAFASPAGESGRLATYNDPVLGQLYRLTALDGAITDFRTTGRVLRHFALPGIQDVTFTWTDTLLTAVKDATGLGCSLIYTSGKLVQIRDPANRVTAVSIVNGQLVKVTDPAGLRDSLSYFANSLLSQVRDRAAGVWNYAYNALNQLSSVTGPTAVDYTGASVRPTTSYTTVAIVVWQPGVPGTSASAPKANVRPDTVTMSATDALGYVTKVALDRFGLATKIVDALGQVTTITRDTLGHATLIQRPNGQTISRTYNGYLLMSEWDNSTGESRSYVYNAANQVQTVTGGVAKLDYYYHDGSQGPAGTLRMVYAGNTASPGHGPFGGTVVASHYPNAYGQDTLVVDGGNHRTRIRYAALAVGGNPIQVTDPKGRVTSYHYDYYGLVDTTTLPTGAKRWVGYDVLNRVRSSMNELGHITQYFYTSPLGLTGIQDAKGQVYKFVLNAWGLTVARRDLGDTTRLDSLKYDVGGNLRTVRTRRGDVITMTYDALGRLRTRSGPDFPQETFTYGANDAWLVAANANGRDSIAYTAGRPIFASQRMPNGTTTYTMSYTYDSRNRLVSRSAPAGGNVARWVYNENLGTLDTLCGVGTCTGVARDAETKPITLTNSPGQSGAWSHVQVFDSLHLVTRDTFTVSQVNAKFGRTWKYDSLARLVQQGFSNTSYKLHNYRYDQAGRLTNGCYWNGPPLVTCNDEYGGSGTDAYRYDASGNRTDSLALAVVGPGNRTQQFKRYALSYNFNGDLLQKAGLGPQGMWNSSDTTAFQWNALGQLTRVEKWPAGGSHTVTTFVYNALGRRVAKTVNGVTTWFVYDGDEVVMDVNASSGTTVAEYAYFPGLNNLFAMRTAGWTGVAIKDPVIHTVLGIAAAQGGAVIKEYAVPSPWGQVSNDTGTLVRFRKGGQEYDQETGLYYLRARHYDPQLGRFLSEDPLGVAGGLNLYAYAGNDPVNGRDPTGLLLPTMDGGGGGDGWCVTFTRTVGSETAEIFAGGRLVSSNTRPRTTSVTMCGGGGGGRGEFAGGSGGWGGGGGGVGLGTGAAEGRCSNFSAQQCARLNLAIDILNISQRQLCRALGGLADSRLRSGQIVYDVNFDFTYPRKVGLTEIHIPMGRPIQVGRTLLGPAAFSGGLIGPNLVHETFHAFVPLATELQADLKEQVCDVGSGY